MWRALILVLALGFAGVSSGKAQEMLPPNPDIQATIQSQFDAFVARDVEGAFQYASPGIRGFFGSAERFGMMVQQGYPMVWDPGQVDFIDLQSLGSVIVQRVQVIDQAGDVHYLGYGMAQGPGGWVITGVQILEAPGVGA